MDHSRLLKFKAGAFFIAMVSLTACSSSQVDDAEAPPPETAGDPSAVEATATADATTDAVPPPAGEDPSLAQQAPPAGGVPDAALDSNNAAPPPPAGESGPIADANSAPPAPIADAAPATPTLDTPPAAAPTPDTSSSTSASTSTPPATTGAPDAMAASPTGSDPAPVAAPMTDTAAKSDSDSGDGVKYKVKRGDTLMKIAFENYGDLYRWKEIYESNRSRIQDPNHVPPGTQLTLNGAGMVTIERNGEQYLIKHGDTLGVISDSVYGTPKKWKKLWENNRQLIKDPNKIYAGFYLYYQPEGRLSHDQDSAPAANDGESASNAPQNLPFRDQNQAPAVNTAANTAPGATAAATNTAANTVQPAAAAVVQPAGQAVTPGSARTPASK